MRAWIAHQIAAVPDRVRRFAVPIIIGWVLLAGVLNAVVPQLERVVATHSPAFLQADAWSSTAVTDMARAFGEGETNNTVYIALVGDDPLGAEARGYYSDLVGELRADPLVDSVRDLWSDAVVGAANESADHRAAYVQLWLHGSMGETRSFEAIDRVEQIVAQSDRPETLRTYVTGPSVILANEFHTADRDILVITAIAFIVVLGLLLLVYRSVITAVLPLISVGLALLVARPVIGLLGIYGLIEASMFASAMSAALILGAGTDYAIFFLGRYHEAIRTGQSRGQAYLSAYRGINHIVVASALTIAGTCACLAFAQIVVLKTSGIPSAIGILVGLAAALTLTPALVAVASSRGHLDPATGTERDLRWRRLGTAVVRWPGPTFVAAAAALAVLMLGLLTLHISFDEVGVQPSDSTGVRGMNELQRHFPNNQATPDFVTITADHDMRNPSDAVAIEGVSRALAKRPDVDSVQSIARPTGRLLAESLLVNQAGSIGNQLQQNSELLGDRLGDLKRVDDGLGAMVTAIDTVQDFSEKAGRGLESTAGDTRQTTDGMQTVRQSAQDVAAALDPLRRMVSDSPNCAGDLLCNAAQTAVQAYDRSPLPVALDGLTTTAAGADDLSEDTGRAVRSMRAAINNLSAIRANVAALQTKTDRVVGTLDVLAPQLDTATGYLQELGHNFGASESGVFYLPQQVFDDPRFAVAMNALYSPDGRTTRLLIFGTTPAFGYEGIERAREIDRIASDAVRGSRLDGSVVQVGGVGATFSDVDRIIARDLKILVIVTMLFVFSVVLVVLRSLVAAITVVTTVAVSFGAAIGASTLVWQHLFSHPLHWAVPPLAFIALVAVGSDYNLLFTARFREEAPGGLRTGTIRAFAGTGSVVTTAGVVFATTMFAMLGSSLTNIMQLGSTIGMGLLVDTFIVRAVIVPAIATQLGMWFWWPLPRRAVLGGPDGAR